MVTIELTDEEYFMLKEIMQRIFKQNERKPRYKKWIKKDGLMINIKTGAMLDTATNKIVIDQIPQLEDMTKLRLENTLDR